MAEAQSTFPANPDDPKAAKAKLKADKKEYQKQLKQQRKEAKEKAQEFADRTAEINGDNAGGFATIVITFLIILIWLAIMALLIKLDVGGFGSDILAPLIKDVPYLNLILPDSALKDDSGTGDNEVVVTDATGQSTTLEGIDEAKAYIKRLEQALQDEMVKNSELTTQNEELKAQVERLEPFEQQQKEFYEERAKFYAEVVYADNAPDPSNFATYYEMIDPENAAKIYEKVVAAEVDDAAIQAFANTYSSMKAKQAASIFNEMVDENQIQLVSRILAQMTVENRSDILAAMDKANAAKLTQLLEPSVLENESTQVTGGK